MEAVAKASDGEREALLGLFTALLRPLMPVALERGVSAREISDAVRRAYVQVLETRMAGQDRTLSDARLALFAGLTRSEVRLFRDPQRTKASPAIQAEGQFNQAAKVLSVWHTHPRFSGAYGLALDLDLEATSDSPRRSFSELVETACTGADRDTILDELIAIGSAEVIDRTTIRCRSRAAVWRGSDDVTVDRIDRAARCLEAAASSFAHNLQQESSDNLYFERMVVSDHSLSPRGRDEFSTVAQARGESYVAELDTWLSKHTQPDDSPMGRRYGVGVYFFEDAQVERHGSGAETIQASGSGAGIRKAGVEEIDVLALPTSMKRDLEKPGNLK